MIPEGGPEIVEASAPWTASEVRADPSAHAVDRVTLGAALLAEHTRAGQRVLRGVKDPLAERGPYRAHEHDQRQAYPRQDPVHRMRRQRTESHPRPPEDERPTARVILPPSPDLD